MNGLELSNVTLRAGDFIVDDVSLSVPAGQYFILMGHTGAGKTLLMKAVCGLQEMVSGRVAIDGRDVTAFDPCRRAIGYVPQEGGLFPHLNVFGNIAFALDLLGLGRHEIIERVEEMAEGLGVSALLGRRVGRLSGGERQKVALARALTRRPRLLLLDEPISALDEATRETISLLLKRVHEQYSLTTIHICHNPAEAQQLGDRVGVMSGGRLVADESRSATR
ncbi:MAG: ATP-binding cassette domain-containing protein [Planctomycetaceae bacterium]|nr:ATP-binding cassette domain-containing protein [Planctomycetaceae bacterium]